MRRPSKRLEFRTYRLLREKVERQHGGRDHKRFQRKARRPSGASIVAWSTVHAIAPSARECRAVNNRRLPPIIVTSSASIIEAAIASCGFCASSHKLYE